MQFIAVRGIEYGLQIVTRFLFNSSDCLYTKKSCKFFHSYEKVERKAKFISLFVLFQVYSMEKQNLL